MKFGLNRFKYTYKKIIKNLFLYRIESDVKRYMNMVDKMKLKKKVEKNMDKRKYDNHIEREVTFNIWNYLTYIVINTYSIGKNVVSTKDTIQGEVRLITDKFIKAYKEGLNGDLDLSNFIPKYPVNFEDLDLVKIIPKDKIEEELQKDVDVKDKISQALKKIKESDLVKSQPFYRPNVEQYAVALWYIIYKGVKDTKKLSKEYGVNFINDGEKRCLFNVFNLILHFILMNEKLLLSKEDMKIIFAVSALHPTHDDLLDNGKLIKEAIDDIMKKLRGEEVKCTHREVKPIFDLIDIIYDKYPPKSNPMLVEIFTKLNYWQDKSSKQKSKCSLDELLEISFMKGGYAFALYGYMVVEKMTIMQFRHFFAMGAIFQIMDDMHDIEEDLKSNTLTVWTSYVKNKEYADNVMKGIISVQKEFERITPIIKEFKHPVCIRRIELIGIRFDIIKFFCMNSKCFSENLKNQFQYCIPLDIEVLINGLNKKKLKTSSFNDYLDILNYIKKLYI